MRSGPKGILFYPDGKRFEGTWREDKINNTGIYYFPNGCAYQVNYNMGVKQGEGKVIKGNMSIDQIRQEYKSLAKRAMKGRELLKKPNKIDRQEVHIYHDSD